MDTITQIILATITAGGTAWGLWLKYKSDKNTVQIESIAKEQAILKAENESLKKEVAALQEKDRTNSRIIAHMQEEITKLRFENAALKEYNQKLEAKLNGRQLL